MCIHYQTVLIQQIPTNMYLTSDTKLFNQFKLFQDMATIVKKKLKVAYNNSLRTFLILLLHNRAREMFANLSIPSFDE